MPGGWGLLAWGGVAGGPQCYTGSRPPRPAPKGPHPGLQVVHGSGAGWAQGGGQTYKPTTGGTPGEDPQGACVTLLTQPCPQRQPRLRGVLGRPQLAPPLPQRTDGVVPSLGGASPRDASLGGGNGGPQRKEVLWRPPHGQPRSLTLSLGWTPEGKERHPLPHGGWEAGLSPPSLRGTLAPPGETGLGGAATTPTPTPAPGPLAGAAGPRTPSSGPPADRRRVPGCETGKRTGGSVRPCKEALRDPAQDAGPAGRGKSPTSLGVDGHVATACLWEPPAPRVPELGRSPPQGPARRQPAEGPPRPECCRPRPAVPSPQRSAHGSSSSGRRWASPNVRGRPRPLLASRPRRPPGWSADLRSTRDRAHPAGLGPASAHCTGWKVWGWAGQDHMGPEAETRTTQREHEVGGVRGCPCSLR